MKFSIAPIALLALLAAAFPAAARSYSEVKEAVARHEANPDE